MDERFCAHNILHDDAVVVFPAVIFRVGGFLKRKHIHVVVLFEQSIRRSGETENLDVVVLLNQRFEGFVDELDKFVCLVQPDLELKLAPRMRA